MLPAPSPADSFSEVWKARYGTDSPALPEELQGKLLTFLSHRSIRNFSDRPVPDALARALVGVANSAATSSNLQLFSIVSVQDPDRREAIAKLAGDQDHIRNAGHFFVFLADHDRLWQENARRNLPVDGYEYTESFLVSVVDASLAAERLVCAAEAIGLGTCYIGAIRNQPEGIKETLGLQSCTFALFGLCIGYPDPTVETQVRPKLGETLWHHETYDHTRSLDDYDRRIGEFYVSENMGGEKQWSLRSALRMTPGRMSGRETLRDWLQSQGFLRK